MAKLTKLKSGDKFVFNDSKGNDHMRKGGCLDVRVGKIYTVSSEGQSYKYFNDDVSDARSLEAFEEYKVTKII